MLLVAYINKTKIHFSLLFSSLLSVLSSYRFFLTPSLLNIFRDDDPWKLPTGALALIIKCLREDPDENIKHYAAKLVENVMAQGGKEYKLRLASPENVDKLIEIVVSGCLSTPSHRDKIAYCCRCV